MLFKNREKIIENGQTPELKKIREDILDILTFALDSVNPYEVVKSRFYEKKINIGKETVDPSDFENIYVVGFGKASVGMAQAICDSIDVKKGVIITNDPTNKVRSERVDTFVGSHPIPDQNSIGGTDKILDIIKMCGNEDLLIALISGGGSALLCKPRVSLKDLQQTTDLLLRSGADINEINTIRKHLSFVKGGQLAKFAKCRAVSFIISDIVGDPMEFIASGPTYPDSTTYDDAKMIFKKYDIWKKLPSGVTNILNDGVQGILAETPKKGDHVFDNLSNFIVANNEIACKAAEDKARKLGYTTKLLTTSLTGEAREIGVYLVDKAKNYSKASGKYIFISGGETTVTIKGSGKGGRNQEMVLGSVECMADTDIVFASFATDGIDGKSDATGAVADGFSLVRAREKGLDPAEFLKENNSYNFFKRLDDLFMTGPTGTNVMDIQIIVA
jgi:glycerate 2-kinase